MTDWLDKIGGQLVLGVSAVVLGIGGREWIVRARSGTKRMAAEDDAQVSVLGEALQRESALLARIDKLTVERDQLKGELEQARTRLTVVQMLADVDERRGIEITKDSAFVDLSRPLRPKPMSQRPSGHDPFQAADPYAPPEPKKRK